MLINLQQIQKRDVIYPSNKPHFKISRVLQTFRLDLYLAELGNWKRLWSTAHLDKTIWKKVYDKFIIINYVQAGCFFLRINLTKLQITCKYWCSLLNQNPNGFVRWKTSCAQRLQITGKQLPQHTLVLTETEMDPYHAMNWGYCWKNTAFLSLMIILNCKAPFYVKFGWL